MGKESERKIRDKRERKARREKNRIKGALPINLRE
jgi:hypothetical protein